MKKTWIIFISGLLLSLATSMARSGIEIRNFDNKDQEVLYNQLMFELRCLVCQNENLAASNADLAKDLRDEVFGMITEQNLGETEVKAFLVARYGDFVLYKPPVKKSTWILWFGPFMLLVLGSLILVLITRNNKNKEVPQLDKSKRDEVRKLLKGEGES